MAGSLLKAIGLIDLAVPMGTLCATVFTEATSTGTAAICFTLCPSDADGGAGILYNSTAP